MWIEPPRVNFFKKRNPGDFLMLGKVESKRRRGAASQSENKEVFY